MESNERPFPFEGEMVAEEEGASGGTEARADALPARLDEAGESQRTKAGPDARVHTSFVDDGETHFNAEQRQQLADQWAQIQSVFVDRPRDSLQRADGLVVDVMQRVTSGFTRERERLEARWEQNDSISTEDLRTALTDYRDFFNRLLSV